MNNLQNKTIAIVGGGPGGLTLARLLQMQGASVKLYERDADEHARQQGATLDLHEESGLLALEHAGLMDAFWAAYRPGADLMRITDQHAVVLHDDGGDKTATRPEIDRGPLRSLLMNSLQPGTIVWNSQFSSMEREGEGWALHFKNGSNAYADIVIGADGARSAIRPLLTDIQPFYTGYTMVEGAVYHADVNAPEMYKLVNGGKVFALGESKTLIASAKGDGSLVFYTGNHAPENWVKESRIDFTDKAQVKAWFVQEFAGWGSAWLELFDGATDSFIPRPQYCMPTDQFWQPQTNLTIIGDAAHLMPPYAGEGVNMAMQDALELAQCLTNPQFASLQEAIGQYQKQMFERMAKMAQMTLDQTAVMHAPDGLADMLDMFKEHSE